MRKSILDTNVLLRFFVGDHPAHLTKARTFFQEAEKGSRSLIVLPIVIAETIFVLESFYAQSQSAIANTLEIFLSQRWLEVVERDILLFSVEQYRQSGHFVDCYLSAWCALESHDLITFDAKLKKKTMR